MMITVGCIFWITTPSELKPVPWQWENQMDFLGVQFFQAMQIF